MLAVGLAILALIAQLAVSAYASGHAKVRVGARPNARLHETILVDPRGRTLYHLTTESARHIVCTGACAKLWPPLLVRSRGARLLAGHGVRGRLSLVRRPDGTLQVAFDGLPLYTFAHDHRPGEANGQGFGGVWFVLAQRARHRGHHTRRRRSGTGGSTPRTTPPAAGGPPGYGESVSTGSSSTSPSTTSTHTEASSTHTTSTATTKTTTTSSLTTCTTSNGIPQCDGGDMDGDNNGGPSDGDGNI